MSLSPEKIAAKLDLMLGPHRKEMSDWLRSLNQRIPSEVNRLTVAEWAEKKRFLPEGLTPQPGPFRFDSTPYLREICDCLSESSPVQKIAIMKGARLGFSVGMGENWMGYVIDAAPAPMIYVSADEETLKQTMEVRVDRMIQESGLQGKIFAQVRKTRGKSSGDTQTKKEFAGGYLIGMGPNSGSKARNWAAKYVHFDETEAAPQEIKGEGSPLSLIAARQREWGDSKKTVYTSTPALKQTSHIEPLFLAGDQRYFYVPCPHCEHMQTIKWGKDHLVYKVDEETGNLITDSVHYVCEKCHGKIINEDKYKILNRGEWRPTAQAQEPNSRSYHISGLYSMFYSWTDVCQDWIRAKSDPLKLQSFINTVLGETFEERGEAPPAQEIASRAEEYQCEQIGNSGAILYSPIPSDKIRLVTLGADVQADRIECEVVAWGRDKESWSLGYHVLQCGKGEDTSNPDGSCWIQLREIIMSQHAGFAIELACIDSGFRPEAVYQFCDQFSGGVVPIKGTESLWNDRAVFQVRNVVGYICQRVDLNTSMLKSEIYASLKQEARAVCHFPENYPDKYYQMLTAEEYRKVKTKSGKEKMEWSAGSRRNESLDCRCYNLAALYVVATGFCVQSGLETNDWQFFWDQLENHA